MSIRYWATFLRSCTVYLGMRAKDKKREGLAAPDGPSNRGRAQPESARSAFERRSFRFPQAVASSNALLRAYILADAALVRRPLPRHQYRQVALAVAKTNSLVSSESALLVPKPGTKSRDVSYAQQEQAAGRRD